jgi:ribonuclease HI
MALGECAEVYDAEMEGLASGAEAAQEWLEGVGADHGIRQIRFFADNTGAIQRIYKGTPGLDQACSLRFRGATHRILDAYPEIKIEISWVPGHHDIPGNDIADRLAKRGSTDIPLRPGYKTAAFAGNMSRRDLRDSWHRVWEADANRHRRSDFSIANKMPPSTNPSKRLRELDRKTFSRVFQCRTGHAHIGSYYKYFEIQEPKTCACGAMLQTRKHILLECTVHEEHHHILTDANGATRLEDILATAKGIERLARFITATGAYDKPPEE